MQRSLCLMLAACLSPAWFSMAGNHELGLKSHFEHSDKLVPMNMDMVDDLGGNTDLFGDVHGFITLYPGNELIVGYVIGDDENLFHIWNLSGLKSRCPITRDIAKNDERNFYYIPVLYLQHEFDICKKRENSLKKRGPWHMLSAALGPRKLEKLKIITSHQRLDYLLSDYEPQETIYNINIDIFIRYILYPLLQSHGITIREWFTMIHMGKIGLEYMGRSSSFAWQGGFKDPIKFLELIQKHVENKYNQKEIFECLKKIKFALFFLEDNTALINEQFVEKKIENYIEQLKLIVPEQIYAPYEHEKVIEMAFGDRWLWLD